MIEWRARGCFKADKVKIKILRSMKVSGKKEETNVVESGPGFILDPKFSFKNDINYDNFDEININYELTCDLDFQKQNNPDPKVPPQTHFVNLRIREDYNVTKGNYTINSLEYRTLNLVQFNSNTNLEEENSNLMSIFVEDCENSKALNFQVSIDSHFFIRIETNNIEIDQIFFILPSIPNTCQNWKSEYLLNRIDFRGGKRISKFSQNITELVELVGSRLIIFSGNKTLVGYIEFEKNKNCLYGLSPCNKKILKSNNLKASCSLQFHSKDKINNKLFQFFFSNEIYPQAFIEVDKEFVNEHSIDKFYILHEKSNYTFRLDLNLNVTKNSLLSDPQSFKDLNLGEVLEIYFLKSFKSEAFLFKMGTCKVLKINEVENSDNFKTEEYTLEFIVIILLIFFVFVVLIFIIRYFRNRKYLLEDVDDEKQNRIYIPGTISNSHEGNIQ